MSSTSATVGFPGEGEAMAILALQAGVSVLGFERSHSRHGPW